jgi:hypothetical protein
MNCRNVISADMWVPSTVHPVQHLFIICIEYNLTGGKNIINASMLHIIEIKVERLCVFTVLLDHLWEKNHIK